MLKKIRNNWRWGALLLPLVLWLAAQISDGFFEGTGWGPKQITAKLSKLLTESSVREKAKIETGSIPAPAPKPDQQSDAQKQEAAARARKARCEKERITDLMEAEKELAVYDYRARSCVAEARQSIFTAGNPAGACKAQIDAKDASGVQRDAIAARKC